VSPSRIAVYGTGRAGRAIAAAARDAGLALGALWNRGASQAATAAQELGVEVASGKPPPPAGDVSVVFIAVADHAITEVCESLVESGALASRPVVAHLSGTLGTHPLRSAADAGCATGSLHPARALQGGATALTGALCALDGESQALQALEGFAAVIGCRSARVPGPLRALYHAATAIASNDVTALIERSAGLLAAAGVERRLAQDAAIDLARGALVNAERLGPAAALTGPVVRGEVEVLARHLAALSAEAPEIAEVHRRLSLILVHLARAQGTPEELLEPVISLLSETAPG